MMIERKTMGSLLAFDFATTVVVFNIISHYRGISQHFIVGPLLVPLLTLVFAIYLIDGYRARTDMLSVDYASQHVLAILSAMAATLLITFAVMPEGYPLQSSRIALALSFASFAPITLGYRRLIFQQAMAERGERSLVFLGDRASCEAFRVECEKMKNTQPVIYSVVSESSAAPFTSPSRTVLRPFHDVLEEVRANQFSVEAIVLRESNRELLPEVSQELTKLYFDGLPTYTLELFHQIHWQKIPLYRLNQTWLFQEGFQIAREPVFERLKRASDVGFALTGLLLAAPLIAIAGLAVFIEDRGGIFFAQTRIGRNRVPFRLLKLRSMRPGGSKDDPYTRPGDSRITRVGKLLRASRLDELPQLWNVLRGEMSLIGPRAEWDRLVEEYELQIPCYHFRHLVKPGITGWAQVNYPYGANMEDTIRKLEYDLYYIRYFSFVLDASIVLKTVHIMLFGKGR